jgi:hypothetical protein
MGNCSVNDKVRSIALDLLANGLLAVFWTAFSVSRVSAIVGGLMAVSSYWLLRLIYGGKAAIVMFLFVAIISVQCIVVQTVLMLVWSN